MKRFNPDKAPRAGSQNYELERSLVLEEAFARMDRARRTERVLTAAGLLGSRRLLILSPSNDVVPAKHYRFGLAPRAREQEVADVHALVIRIPVIPTKDAPKSCIEGFWERHPLPGTEIPEEIATNDIFIEAVTGNRSNYFLLRPAGLLSYGNATDVHGSRADTATTRQVFTIKPEAMLAEALACAADEQALDVTTLTNIMYGYELAPQENARSYPKTA